MIICNRGWTLGGVWVRVKVACVGGILHIRYQGGDFGAGKELGKAESVEPFVSFEILSTFLQAPIALSQIGYQQLFDERFGTSVEETGFVIGVIRDDSVCACVRRGEMKKCGEGGGGGKLICKILEKEPEQKTQVPYTKRES